LAGILAADTAMVAELAVVDIVDYRNHVVELEEVDCIPVDTRLGVYKVETADIATDMMLADIVSAVSLDMADLKDWGTAVVVDRPDMEDDQPSR
jgi:hypothetical protein